MTIAAVETVTTLATAGSGGSQTLVVDGTGPDLSIMGLTAGANITLTPGSGSVTIAATEPATTMLATAGSGGSQTLVVDGTGPDLTIMGLTAGANITLTPSAGSVTIAATEPATTMLATAGSGGSQTLVVDGTGPDLTIMGLEAGSFISLTPASGCVGIAVTGGGGGFTAIDNIGSGVSVVRSGATPPTATINSLIAGTNVTIVDNWIECLDCCSRSVSLNDLVLNGNTTQTAIVGTGATYGIAMGHQCAVDGGAASGIAIGEGVRMQSKGQVLVPIASRPSLLEERQDQAISGPMPVVMEPSRSAVTTIF